jgi:hypothetical protein
VENTKYGLTRREPGTYESPSFIASIGGESLDQNKRSLIWGAVVIFGLLTTIVMTSFLWDASKVEKGTWIWDAKTIVNQKDQILTFAKGQQVSTIYLYINQNDVTPQEYGDFIHSAGQKGIKVEALAGQPEWALPAHQGEIKEFISWVKQFNASAQTDGKFQGVHFDIEPYLLNQWETERDSLLTDWMNNVRFIQEETKGTGLKLTADVPYWIYKIKAPNSNEDVSTWLLKKFDCLVLMDYRNYALGHDGIVENAREVMRQAVTLKKQAIVAVDTTKSSESDRTTFHSLTMSEMESELKLAKKQLARYSSFSGFAIHDYSHWVAISTKT